MLSVVERARWRGAGLCALLFPGHLFLELIFSTRGAISFGRMPTELKSLVGHGSQLDWSGDFWRWEKRSGIALEMILIGARKLDLKAGLFIA